MLNITEICKHYGKLPTSFTSKKCCRKYLQYIKIVEGAQGGTKIPDELAEEFYLWLSTETRQMVLNGTSTEDITKYVNALPTPKKEPK